MTREEAIGNIRHAIRWNDMSEKEALDMAIKALEQEPCEDCISRQAVLNLINADWKYEGLEEDVSSLSPVTPQPKTGWIPVSERLPEKNVWVLVTVEQSGNRHQEIMRRDKYIEAWTDNIDNYIDEVIAWMPLPEPYKAESEDKE